MQPDSADRRDLANAMQALEMPRYTVLRVAALVPRVVAVLLFLTSVWVTFFATHEARTAMEVDAPAALLAFAKDAVLSAFVYAGGEIVALLLDIRRSLHRLESK